MNTYIHKTAIIEESADIGEGVTIGAFAYIGHNTKIFDGVYVGSYTEIRDNVWIGRNTQIGSRSTFSKDARVGTNCIIKYGFVLTDTPDLNSPAKVVGRVGNNVKIGANVTLMPGFNIEDNSTVGSCSQVRSDIPEDEVWFGNPAKRYG